MSTIRRGLLIGSAILCGERATAQLTSCVSVNSSEVPGIGTSVRASISADGRYVVFGSAAANLAGPDANANWDAFVRDLQARTTECVSVDASGHAGNGASYTDLARAISQDGRFVVFRSDANDLVAGDTNGVTDVFVRDRQSGTTECASVDSGGASANGASSDAAISADGRFVAFTSTATNLVPGTSIVARRVFLRDLQSGTTELVSVRIGGADADAESYGPSLSADGRFAAFTSWLPDLAAGDTNGRADVFVRDRQAGTTEIASLGDSGQLGNEDCLLATISPDGNFVAFESAAADLVPADTNGFMVDVFLRDRVAATTDLVSVSTSGAQGPFNTYGTSLSADGRFVCFSTDSELIPGGGGHIYLRDRQAGTTEVVSRNTAGWLSNGGGENGTISDDGRYVAFESSATNLSGLAIQGHAIFLRDRSGVGAFDFTSLCSPGTGGVIACPCANPPSGPDRGCDNSSSTGGAILAASGVTQLTSDGLTFTTSGERPMALSLLVQGSAHLASGAVYGQGVRCAGGSLLRLYVRTASSGSIQVPDWSLWDPSVSAKSRQRGDPIQPGQSRWYFVYYRDPAVLGGCSPTSTFNATQTGRVGWSL